MPREKILRFIVFGIGTGVMVEICFYGCKLLYEAIKRAAAENEINEAHFLNELSDSCGPTHLQQRHQLDQPERPICKNPHCAVQKINRIVQLFDSAKYSIDICIYTFTSYMLAESVKKALQRGVSIRIISDREMVFSSGSQIKTFVKYSIPVRGPKTTCMMHNKFCIIDGTQRIRQLMQLNNIKKPQPYRPVILSGSINWTSMGFGGNWENFFITNNPAIVDKYEVEFNRLWQSLEIV